MQFFCIYPLDLGMDKLRLERISACALNRIFGYEPRFSIGFMQALGSASAVFDLSESELRSMMGPFSRHQGEINEGAREEAEKELDRLESRGCGFIAYSEAEYPHALKECEDAPAGLYVRTSSPYAEVFGGRPAISIVGTRDISPYGREWCPKIVGAIAQSPVKPTIVSGLAFGVDISAHLAALAMGLPTIAVLPGPINEVYPKSHYVAAGKIATARGSAIVTDYPPGTAPAAHTFVRRNRIIAGMSQATILVESKIKGGGLITCRLAQGYGRDVFALPGRIDDVRSAGCNMLLSEKVAEPISSLDNLGEQLGLGRYNLRKNKDFSQRISEIYASEKDEARRKAIIETAITIKKRRGITISELCEESGMAYREVAEITGTLECDGVIGIDLMQRCTINPKIC